MDYKPLCDLDNLDAIFTASFVSVILWVLIISAPLITEITSAAIDPNNRAEGSSFFYSFPINDLLEIEIRRG